MIDASEVTAIAEHPGKYLVRSVRLMMLSRDLAACYHTVEELSVKYQVSERTIYRDLAQLQDEPLREPLINLSVWKSERCHH